MVVAVELFINLQIRDLTSQFLRFLATNVPVLLYRKVAPQNIMYDRRVVRGNTFAALVIPVSKYRDFDRLHELFRNPRSAYRHAA